MTRLIFAFVLLAGPTIDIAMAQERQSPAAEFAAGWMGFADDGIVSEGFVGGSLRLYVTSRLSAGPEVIYIHGDNHSHLMVTGNVMWDVLAGTNGGPPPTVTPFFVVGGGIFQTRETFPSGGFTSTEGGFTAGGGIRALVGERIAIGADARFGWELHLRVGLSMTLRLGR